MTLKLPAYILAGGRSLRFEEDKSLVAIQGQTQIQRLISQLERRHRVQVVADRQDRFSKLGIECLVDAFPGEGPLAGILSALRDCREKRQSDWALITGCDQFLWNDDWEDSIRPLLEHSGCSHKYDLIVWKSDATFSPLPGFFHQRLLENLQQLCQSQRWALKNLARSEAVRVCYLPIAQHPREFSFNTRTELQQLLNRPQV